MRFHLLFLPLPCPFLNSLLNCFAGFSDLVRADTNNADAIYLKGLVHYEEGENTKAIQHFIEALRVHPDHEKSRLKLRKTKELEKKKSEGNDAFTSGDLQRGELLSIL